MKHRRDRKTGRLNDLGMIREEPDGDCFSVGPADSFARLCEAFRLVYFEYLRWGYVASDPSEMRFSAFQLLPVSATFVAVASGRVVGTASFVVASSAGLPSSGVFGDLFDSLAAEGRLVTEATMLASVASGSAGVRRTPLRVMPWALAWALAQGADDLCVVVNPRHVDFWSHALGFEPLGEVRPCEHVRGNPGVLMPRPPPRGAVGRLGAASSWPRDAGPPADAGSCMRWTSALDRGDRRTPGVAGRRSGAISLRLSGHCS